MAIITHFTSRADWQQAFRDGVYAADSYETEGFIHCSTPEQVVGVANRIAKERDDLVLLWIDEEKVVPKIIYENLEGGQVLFPHIYGVLNLESVVNVTPFRKMENGEYELPSL